MPAIQTAHILLHACCGPCTIMPVSRLREAGFAVTAYFANPNIHPLSEYLLRRESMARCAAALNLPVLWQDDQWDVSAWLREIPWQTHHAAHSQPCSRARCVACCAARLALTAQAARLHGFEAFTTSLLYSRYQPHKAIAEAGQEQAARHTVGFAYHDFRVDWQQGIDLSKQMRLYRQSYCGCIFSEAERNAKKLQKYLAQDLTGSAKTHT